MKVRFKSLEHKFAFASGSNANMYIAEYMGMEAHTAIQYHSDMIELVNDDKSSISLDNKGKPCGEFVHTSLMKKSNILKSWSNIC